MKGTLTNAVTGGTVHLLSAFMIGRSPESNIVIDDPRTSRRHAMIRRQDEGYWLFDLGSFNGSYINGTRVTTGRMLHDGDILSFAEHEFRFNQIGPQSQEGDHLINGSSTIALIRSHPVIILVTDIHAFTALSEKLTPDDLARIMGSWYSDCEIILSSYGATVDKFIGDSALAYWTNVTESHLFNAAKAARALLESCEKIYQKHQTVFDSVEKSFTSGVALHVGKVAYGGMSQREFTLVGDSVNLTFRIEALTRVLNKNAVVSSDFLAVAPALRNHCENLGIHHIKGRSEPVEVWGFSCFPE